MRERESERKREGEGERGECAGIRTNKLDKERKRQREKEAMTRRERRVCGDMEERTSEVRGASRGDAIVGHIQHLQSIIFFEHIG